MPSSNKNTQTDANVQTETKEILRRRTEYETALVRRVTKKSDFLRYAAYEMQLESLRLKRVERLSYGLFNTYYALYVLI